MKIQPVITFHDVNPNDKEIIELLAQWYLEEFETPVKRTYRRLTDRSGEDLIFHLIVKKEDNIVAAGGLYKLVRFTNTFPQFKSIKPWVGLIYTVKDHRGQGIGTRLMKEIEDRARLLGIPDIYLYTFSAESLYINCGWEEYRRVEYKGFDTVIMKKKLGK